MRGAFWHEMGWGGAAMRRLLAVIVILAAGRAGAAALPGFGTRLLGSTSGFASSLAVDSKGVIYYTTTQGDLLRFDDGKLIAHVDTDGQSDSGLLGMALRDDHTAIVHYTTPNQVADVVSAIDLDSGHETILHSFIADIEMPSRGSPGEHHGGNPSVAADGSIFVGIGDYGGGLIASLPNWNAGKIWRIFPDGGVQQFARGFRNPFDVSWDAAKQRLIVPDNGNGVDDELNIVHLGDDCGWPFTSGDGPPVAGTVAPVYVFPVIVAPTGLLPLSGRNPILQHGYLLGAFVTKAIYYINDIDHPAPIPILKGDTSFVIDVAEGPNGEIYFCTGNAIYQLIVPLRGDCNGDGLVDVNDVLALQSELSDGDGDATTNAQNGTFLGSWGCDVNGDGVIDKADLAALMVIVRPRVRAVRIGH